MGLEMRDDFESQCGVESESNAQGVPILGELGLKRARRSKLEFADRFISQVLDFFYIISDKDWNGIQILFFQFFFDKTEL